MNNSKKFSSFKKLSVNGNSFRYAPLSWLSEQGFGDVSTMPFSIRVLAESVLRNFDSNAFSEQDISEVAGWKANSKSRAEIPYMPARVVLQDFTGVPAVVDLAAMRDSLKQLGEDPNKINPLVPCDLVIDHSVQVDKYGSADALSFNEKIEFSRNKERYELLKWAQSAFTNFRVVPPSTGIVHQVNLEYLSNVVFTEKSSSESPIIYPDSCVGTDSHTPMVNGIGVLAWGVGGIEAEAVVLRQPISMLLPDVIGIKLTGNLPEGTTATDLVLRITEKCREFGVVGKFVEFFGDGMASLSVADRATISNMAPEQGCTVSFFPVDNATLDYMKLTGRSNETIALTEAYYKEQGLFRTEGSPDPQFTDVVNINLCEVEPSLAGPKRPHDRIPLSELGATYKQVLTADIGPKGFGLPADSIDETATVSYEDGQTEKLGHGSVVIAAITSCTNTSNPAVMFAAGLVAKNAAQKGIKVARHVKTSLAPGSRVVTEYLDKSGLLPYLEQLGFYVVGYGCTTCIGNSGPLSKAVASAIDEKNLVVSAVLSGNRNFEGRVSKHTRSNYLASPPLVVAYAIAGSTAIDIKTQPIAQDSSGNDVFLKDLWPTNKQISDLLGEILDPQMYKDKYGDVFSGAESWETISSSKSLLYSWDKQSTYVKEPPFFVGLTKEKRKISSISGARVLGLFGDTVTTDHISPAGGIASDSPAAKYLNSAGVDEVNYNSYGSRRGNHEVMMRGTFANIRLRNKLAGDKVGNITMHFPTSTEMSFFDTAEKYRKSNTPLLLIAGKEYGTGSSRDWAAKGPSLLGVKAVIAESYERIHRSNLIGMGIIPLQFLDGESASSLGLTGEEEFEIELDDTLKPGDTVRVKSNLGEKNTAFTVVSRIDTPVEIQYYRDGGILCHVLKKFAE